MKRSSTIRVATMAIAQARLWPVNQHGRKRFSARHGPHGGRVRAERVGGDPRSQAFSRWLIASHDVPEVGGWVREGWSAIKYGLRVRNVSEFEGTVNMVYMAVWEA